MNFKLVFIINNFCAASSVMNSFYHFRKVNHPTVPPVTNTEVVIGSSVEMLSLECAFQDAFCGLMLVL